MKGSKGGYVEKKMGTAIAVTTVLLVELYFFAPSLWTQAHHTALPVIPDVAESSDVQPIVPIPSTSYNQPQKSTYSVYFNNLKMDSGNDCSEVHPVTRSIDSTNPEAAVLLDLMDGPTADEKAQGYSSAFSDKTSMSLESLAVRDGVAAVGLADIRQLVPNVSSSCGSQAFISAVENTLFQFDGIKKVLFAIEGSPKKFYNWVQMSCGLDNNNCDASMFK